VRYLPDTNTCIDIVNRKPPAVIDLGRAPRLRRLIGGSRAGRDALTTQNGARRPRVQA